MGLLDGRAYVELVGDAIELGRLERAFDRPPRRVVRDGNDVYLDDGALQGDRANYTEADRVVSILKGSMRASGQPCDSVRLGAIVIPQTGGPTIKSIRVLASVSVAACIVPQVTVVTNGRSGPSPRPLAARIADMVESGDPTANDLTSLVRQGEPDWRVLRVLTEIFLGNGYAEAKGMQAKMKLIKRTAGSWDTIGAAAVHHKENVTPPLNPPSVEEARGWALDLVRQWFDEHAPA